MTLIPPRRGEILIDKNGMPTLRLIRYLEQLATDIDTVIEGDPVNEASIQTAAPSISQIDKKINDLYNQIVYNNAMLSRILNKQKDLENLQ